MAAHIGDPVAQWHMGLRYIRGDGLEVDFVKAACWFQRAADLGCVDAQVELGHCFYSADGVEQDVMKALRCFQNAAELGNANAQFQCGLAKVGFDHAMAMAWFHKAADQGHVVAVECLELVGPFAADFAANPPLTANFIRLMYAKQRAQTIMEHCEMYFQQGFLLSSHLQARTALRQMQPDEELSRQIQGQRYRYKQVLKAQQQSHERAAALMHTAFELQATCQQQQQQQQQQGEKVPGVQACGMGCAFGGEWCRGLATPPTMGPRAPWAEPAFDSETGAALNDAAHRMLSGVYAPCSEREPQGEIVYTGDVYNGGGGSGAYNGGGEQRLPKDASFNLQIDVEAAVAAMAGPCTASGGGAKKGKLNHLGGAKTEHPLTILDGGTLHTCATARKSTHYRHGVMFNVVAGGHPLRIHAFCMPPMCTKGTVIARTVTGGYEANKETPENWGIVGEGQTADADSSVVLHQPVLLEAGQMLGVYLHTPSMLLCHFCNFDQVICNGVLNGKGVFSTQPVICNGVLIGKGVCTDSPTPFKDDVGMFDDQGCPGPYFFCGAVQYELFTEAQSELFKTAMQANLFQNRMLAKAAELEAVNAELNRLQADDEAEQLVERQAADVAAKEAAEKAIRQATREAEQAKQEAGAEQAMQALLLDEEAVDVQSQTKKQSKKAKKKQQGKNSARTKATAVAAAASAKQALQVAAARTQEEARLHQVCGLLVIAHRRASNY
jgi:hypothetical protein